VATIPVISGKIEAHLDWDRLVDALAEGHRGPRPLLGDLFLERGADALVSRSAWITGLGIGVKAFTVLPENTGRGLPSVQGAMILFDDTAGRPEAVVDFDVVTKWKTAADSVLGAKLLAREDARRLLIVGAGRVARSLAEAYQAVLGPLEVTVWSRTRASAEALAARIGAHVANDLEEAVAVADIITTATLAHEPVIRGEWLRPGQHLDLIGAFKADMRETDDTALRRGRIFVDSRETTLQHIGELLIPIREGVISPEDVAGDLADLVAGRAGRRTADEITIYKNGGGAHLDLMTARVILDVWQENGRPS